MSDEDENNSLAGVPSPSPGDMGPTHQLVDERAEDNELKEDSFLNLGDEKDFAPNEVNSHEIAEPTTAGQEAERVAALLNSPKTEEPATKRDRDVSEAAQHDEEGANKKQKVQDTGIVHEQQVIDAEQPTNEVDIEPPPVAPSSTGTTVFNDNDVLSGRGGGTNVHPGNRHFRELIDTQRRNYLRARKNDKPSISRMIVRTIRQSNGRFLKKDDKTGLWFEIGDDAAREKTSQALRQRAPEVRKMMYDAEKEQARGVSVEEQIRHQRMMMGMQPDGSVVSMPGMQPGMAFSPNGAPMMFPNPAFFMAAANGGPGTPQSSFKGPPTAMYPHSGAPMNPAMMHPAMADQYQHAMFQAAVMGGMRFHPQSMPMPQQQQPAQLQQQQQQQQERPEQKEPQQTAETGASTTAPIDNIEPTNIQTEDINAGSGVEEVNTGEEKQSSE